MKNRMSGDSVDRVRERGSQSRGYFSSRKILITGRHLTAGAAETTRPGGVAGLCGALNQLRDEAGRGGR